MNFLMRKFITLLLWAVTFVANSHCAYAETPYREIPLGYGDWSKSWFADDFGDPNYDNPYIVTELVASQGTNSIRYFQLCFGELRHGMTFIITIGTRDFGSPHKIRMYGDAIIKIKDSSGNVYSIEASTYNGAILLFDQDDIIKFADLINKGNYHLALIFHSYLDTGGEPVLWTYNCTDETKDFYDAVYTVFGS